MAIKWFIGSATGIGLAEIKEVWGGWAEGKQRLSNVEPVRAPDLRAQQKASVVFEATDLSEPGVVLSAAEAQFFQENGFLVKPGLLNKDQTARALDRVWAHLERYVPLHPDAERRVTRDDRDSWFDPRWASMAPHPAVGPFQGRQPREYYGRTVKLHDIGAAPWLLDLLPHNLVVLSLANAILGDNLKPVRCTRGVYGLFPHRSPSGSPVAGDAAAQAPQPRGSMLGPHMDQVSQQLNVCAYLDDVQPRNGGFTVWPGSHRVMWDAHRTEANWSPAKGFGRRLREISTTIEPFELVGPAGSVIFWHGRTVHSAGIHLGQDVRWALFADYAQDLPVLSDDEHRPLGQYEWFKDTRLFRDDYRVTADMWRHWQLRTG